MEVNLYFFICFANLYLFDHVQGISFKFSNPFKTVPKIGLPNISLNSSVGLDQLKDVNLAGNGTFNNGNVMLMPFGKSPDLSFNRTFTVGHHPQIIPGGNMAFNQTYTVGGRQQIIPGGKLSVNQTYYVGGRPQIYPGGNMTFNRTYTVGGRPQLFPGGNLAANQKYYVHGGQQIIPGGNMTFNRTYTVGGRPQIIPGGKLTINRTYYVNGAPRIIPGGNMTFNRTYTVGEKPQITLGNDGQYHWNGFTGNDGKYRWNGSAGNDGQYRWNGATGNDGKYRWNGSADGKYDGQHRWNASIGDDGKYRWNGSTGNDGQYRWNGSTGNDGQYRWNGSTGGKYDGQHRWNVSTGDDGKYRWNSSSGGKYDDGQYRWNGSTGDDGKYHWNASSGGQYDDGQYRWNGSTGDDGKYRWNASLGGQYDDGQYRWNSSTGDDGKYRWNASSGGQYDDGQYRWNGSTGSNSTRLEISKPYSNVTSNNEKAMMSQITNLVTNATSMDEMIGLISSFVAKNNIKTDNKILQGSGCLKVCVANPRVRQKIEAENNMIIKGYEKSDKIISNLHSYFENNLKNTSSSYALNDRIMKIILQLYPHLSHEQKIILKTDIQHILLNYDFSSGNVNYHTLQRDLLTFIEKNLESNIIHYNTIVGPSNYIYNFDYSLIEENLRIILQECIDSQGNIHIKDDKLREILRQRLLKIDITWPEYIDKEYVLNSIYNIIFTQNGNNHINIFELEKQIMDFIILLNMGSKNATQTTHSSLINTHLGSLNITLLEENLRIILQKIIDSEGNIHFKDDILRKMLRERLLKIDLKWPEHIDKEYVLNSVYNIILTRNGHNHINILELEKQIMGFITTLDMESKNSAQTTQFPLIDIRVEGLNVTQNESTTYENEYTSSSHSPYVESSTSSYSTTSIGKEISSSHSPHVETSTSLSPETTSELMMGTEGYKEEVVTATPKLVTSTDVNVNVKIVGTNKTPEVVYNEINLAGNEKENHYPYVETSTSSYPFTTIGEEISSSHSPYVETSTSSYPHTSIGEEISSSHSPYVETSTSSYPTTSIGEEISSSLSPYVETSTSSYPTTSIGDEINISHSPYAETSTSSYPHTSIGEEISSSHSPYDETSTSSYPHTSIGEEISSSHSPYVETSTSSYPTTSIGEEISSSHSPYVETSTSRYPTTSIGEEISSSHSPYVETSTSSYPTTSIGEEISSSHSPHVEISTSSYPTTSIGEEISSSHSPYVETSTSSYPTTSIGEEISSSHSPYVETSTSSYPTTSIGEEISSSRSPYVETSTSSYPTTSIAEEISSSHSPYVETSTSSYPTTSIGEEISSSHSPYVETSTSSYPTTSIGEEISSSHSPHVETSTGSYPTTSIGEEISSSHSPYVETSTSSYPTTSIGEEISSSHSPYVETSTSSYPTTSIGEEISSSRSPYVETSTSSYPTTSIGEEISSSHSPYVETSTSSYPTTSIGEEKSSSHSPYVETSTSSYPTTSIGEEISSSRSPYVETSTSSYPTTSIGEEISSSHSPYVETSTSSYPTTSIGEEISSSHSPYVETSTSSYPTTSIGEEISSSHSPHVETSTSSYPTTSIGEEIFSSRSPYVSSSISSYPTTSIGEEISSSHSPYVETSTSSYPTTSIGEEISISDSPYVSSSTSSYPTTSIGEEISSSHSPYVSSSTSSYPTTTPILVTSTDVNVNVKIVGTNKTPEVIYNEINLEGNEKENLISREEPSTVSPIMETAVTKILLAPNVSVQAVSVEKNGINLPWTNISRSIEDVLKWQLQFADSKNYTNIVNITAKEILEREPSLYLVFSVDEFEAIIKDNLRVAISQNFFGDIQMLLKIITEDIQAKYKLSSAININGKIATNKYVQPVSEISWVEVQGKINGIFKSLNKFANVDENKLSESLANTTFEFAPSIGHYSSYSVFQSKILHYLNQLRSQGYTNFSDQAVQGYIVSYMQGLIKLFSQSVKYMVVFEITDDGYEDIDDIKREMSKEIINAIFYLGPDNIQKNDAQLQEEVVQIFDYYQIQGVVEIYDSSIKTSSHLICTVKSRESELMKFVPPPWDVIISFRCSVSCSSDYLKKDASILQSEINKRTFKYLFANTFESDLKSLTVELTNLVKDSGYDFNVIVRDKASNKRKIILRFPRIVKNYGQHYKKNIEVKEVNASYSFNVTVNGIHNKNIINMEQINKAIQSILVEHIKSGKKELNDIQSLKKSISQALATAEADLHVDVKVQYKDRSFAFYVKHDASTKSKVNENTTAEIPNAKAR